ncbi:aconitate hydratase AcnA [candidate division KSB1 bacterium]|nr:aconitate hydratase AcnA [candidate division KSB1 bacterium]
MEKSQNSLETRAILTALNNQSFFYSFNRLEQLGIANTNRLPFSMKILLESLLRNEDGDLIQAEDIVNLANWSGTNLVQREIPFKPVRVILQDFTGVPAVVELAALRSAAQALNQNPEKINPQIPVDLVIDHSVQVDHFASPQALSLNAELEFQRNRERYEFLKWAAQNFENFRVVPPATGIVHQVNLEYLAAVIKIQSFAGRHDVLLYPDSLVGTDSHTTMINGLGVLGWGVGGIEAEAVMLGQPLYFLTPEVIGFRLTGALPPDTTATDLVLTITQMLRKKGVVDKFVEFYGPGLETLTLPDRATLANMAPEYGATMGFFPVDQQTLDYLKLTGRAPEQIRAIEIYCKEQGLFRTNTTPDPIFTDTLTLDLSQIEPTLAGPKRPHDRVALKNMQPQWRQVIAQPVTERGYGLTPEQQKVTVTVNYNHENFELSHGAVVIAAITSCTNTSNPGVLLGAGLLAKNAVEAGLPRKPWVKTSLAPGSKVVTDYLTASGLSQFLDALGFHTVGYGCTTCIGNSGPLPEPISKAIKAQRLVAVSVLSGNRNFEGRISPDVQANYLASPPLVVAYALAGRIDIDFETEPIGMGKNGKPVFLRELWPNQTEVQSLVQQHVHARMFQARYGNVFEGNPTWNAIPVPQQKIYTWDPGSTYIQEPPFFKDLTPEISPLRPIQGARVLAWLPDSTTTDHISPAGNISPTSPAGKYLISLGVAPADFNSYGSRRGNHEVMMRGTLANIRIKNKLVPGTEGGITVYQPTGEKMAIWDAAAAYQADQTPLIILAGKEYGSGSSRDWAAKGVLLQGVKAVIAESYERIHRSNLVGMGILPLQFKPDQKPATLGLDGFEIYEIPGLDDHLTAHMDVPVRAIKANGAVIEFLTTCRIDTPVEVEYYKNGGILKTVLRQGM